MQELTIIWRRLIENDETCPRCGSTEKELDKAILILKEKNIEVILKKEALRLDQFKKNPDKSNQILINGKPLEDLLKGKTGKSKCCGVCGDTECRTVEIDGEVHEVVSAEIIVEACQQTILKV